VRGMPVQAVKKNFLRYNNFQEITADRVHVQRELIGIKYFDHLAIEDPPIRQTNLFDPLWEKWKCRLYAIVFNPAISIKLFMKDS
jgi:hypothetical protein